MAKKINIVGSRAKRIKITGPTFPRIDPAELAAALGAEPCGERLSGRVRLTFCGMGAAERKTIT